MTKKDTKETPLMRQHREIKEKYPDAILLFRVGDFYETFGQDAVISSKILGITLTRRANGSAAYIELAGFPHHSLDTYLHKLVKAGYRVAICDQLEDPKSVKGIVKRGVTELVTPGVAVNDKLLDHNANNFLASIYIHDKVWGICFLDISTGELFAAEGEQDYIDKLLQNFQPSELIISKQHEKLIRSIYLDTYYIFAQDEWIYHYNHTSEIILKQFNVLSLKGFGIEEWTQATIAIGACFQYLKDTEHHLLSHITQIQRINNSEFLWMDHFTIRNLELLRSNFPGGKSLIEVLDKTSTPMGGRLLRQWLVFPLCNKTQIEWRQGIVTFFNQNKNHRLEIEKYIRHIGDLERLATKVSMRKVNPRELLQLKNSLIQITELKKYIESACNESLPLEQLSKNIHDPYEVIRLIEEHILEDAPAVLNKGDVIQKGIHEELDELRMIRSDSKNYLLQIQVRESERTGIPSLKIGFNNVFGYYLEVTHAHKDKVPTEWIRKQTLTNAERYITDELKVFEEKILGAEDKILLLEQQIYNALLDQLLASILFIQNNAKIIAQIDCLLSFSIRATESNYHLPIITEEKVLKITQGRHPVIEANLPIGTPYIPNDIELNNKDQQIIIITGPNMSGKSAVLRQVALITLLAHIGSYVPAQAATIPITDMLYTRVGASDNLSGGESTFMVEMNETASILNNISSRSLVILDEIGRGTSTFDGISIAWSIVEYLQQHSTQPFTLFATHYHELNEIENQSERVKNFHITHQETDGKIIFLRKLARGGSMHSFGIQVAKMAGMPKSLTKRAQEILEILESQRGENNTVAISTPQTLNYQLNIFDGIGQDLRQMKEILSDIDINTLTPVEALVKLNEIQKMLNEYSL